MAISPGETVGPYRIIEQLGSGGMATVYKAYHAALDRYVAVKVLHPALKQTPQFFERFKREARIVANLEHPNIIPVYDFSEHRGEPYLVMRFVEGNTLKAKMDRQPLPHAQILQLMRPVCQALDYAHRQGVLHRDIKPSNVMITTDGNVFLTDFGLARMVQAGESTLSQDMMVGTPQYISPEQAQGLSKLDGRTDIYSLGVVLYEMLTGRVPFNADTPFATIHDHIYTPLPLPSDINPKISPAIERLLLKALAKNPEDRFATVNDLLTALETTLNAPVATVIAPPAAQKGLPWWVWAGGAVALVVLLVGAMALGALLTRTQKSKSPTDQPTAMQPIVRTLPTVTATPSPPEKTPSPIPPPPARTPPPKPPQPGDNPPQPNGNRPPSNSQADDLTRQANQAMRDQQLDKAAQLYQQAITTDPHHLPAYVGLSQAQRMQGQTEASVATLQQAVDANPANAQAWIRLGEGQLFTGRDPNAALVSFQQAAKLDPNSPMPLAGQAIAYTELKQPDQAKNAINAALALDPNNLEAHLANAYYLKEQGNRLAALRELRQLAKNNAASPLLKERVRQLLTQLGE